MTARGVAAGLVATLVLLAGCTSAPQEASTNPVAPTTAVSTPSAESTPTPVAGEETAPVANAVIELPSAAVTDLVSGADADLASLGVEGPALLWFWAPH